MELFKIGFLPVRLVDILDVGLVTYVFYKLYELLRGSLSIRIFIAIVSVFLFWKLVDLLDFVLLTSILNQFIGVGAIALIILFAPEIRRFLLLLGRNTILDRLFQQGAAASGANSGTVNSLIDAIEEMAGDKIGALIVVTKEDMLDRIRETGDLIEAEISERLLKTIFVPESPMHDGAVIITGSKINSSRCVLPLSQKKDLPARFGLRHRAGLGISEVSDALAIIVSEERGQISVAVDGNLYEDLDPISIERMLMDHYSHKSA